MALRKSGVYDLLIGAIVMEKKAATTEVATQTFRS